ncbi:MAG TPA: anthranilate phosphoribosyltransferase [Planctomycetota bacterium]|nr:anthranilate phosphoribosyltransferase [Planctomycetota bacterium]
MFAASESFSIKPILDALLERRDLSREQSRDFMAALIDGRMPPASIAAFAIALHMKGESVEELAALAGAMRERAVPIHAPVGALDTCGTGGDCAGTFNISTAAALVVAGMGIPVAKHGGRAATGATGSADVLKALGVNVDAPPEIVERCVREAGIGFLFAPTFHPGMRHAAAVRRELGVRTVFNLLGPLSNPAGAKHQLLGVCQPDLCEKFARVLMLLGSESAMVVCGAAPDGRGHLDEISTFGPTTVARLKDGDLKIVSVDPLKLGVAPGKPEELLAADAAQSAALIRATLDGARGSARDIVVLNAAAAAQIAGLAPTWVEGLNLATESIDSGKARVVLAKLVAVSGG